MKKLLMVAIATFGLMSITSCGPNDEPDEPNKGKTTVQVMNNATPATSDKGADGTMYETNVIFYSDAAELDSKSIGNVSAAGGQSAEMEATKGATKVRLSFKLSPSSGVEYTVDYFSLTAETLTVISITDDTMLTTTKGETKGETITLREALSRL